MTNRLGGPPQSVALPSDHGVNEHSLATPNVQLGSNVHASSSPTLSEGRFDR